MAAVVLPTCSALVLSQRLNAETDKLMKAQLAVSSAVETLMAEGIPTGTEVTDDGGDYGKNGDNDRFPDVIIKITSKGDYFNVTFIAAADEDVYVETTIRAKGGS